MASALWACALLCGAWQAAPAATQKQQAEQPLAEAVRALNMRAAGNAIGREQPALTEDEVVASIKWMAVDRPANTTDEEMHTLETVAATRRLPAGVGFEFLTGFQPDDRTVFTAWSVRLVLPRPNGGTHAFVVRDRWIASRPIGPEERKVIRRWEEKWRKQGGVASFDRIPYAKEREEAVKRDYESTR